MLLEPALSYCDKVCDVVVEVPIQWCLSLPIFEACLLVCRTEWLTVEPSPIEVLEDCRSLEGCFWTAKIYPAALELAVPLLLLFCTVVFPTPAVVPIPGPRENLLVGLPAFCRSMVLRAYSMADSFGFLSDAEKTAANSGLSLSS